MVVMPAMAKLRPILAQGIGGVQFNKFYASIIRRLTAWPVSLPREGLQLPAKGDGDGLRRMQVQQNRY
jgi:hypothetical protein